MRIRPVFLLPVFLLWTTGSLSGFDGETFPSAVFEAYNSNRNVILEEPVSRIGDYLFIRHLQELDMDAPRDLLDLVADGMLTVNDHLLEFGRRQLDKQPKADNYRSLLRLAEEVGAPSVLEISLAGIPMQVVQNGILDGRFVYAVAVRETDANRIIAKSTTVDVWEILDRIRQHFLGLREDLHAIEGFLVSAGCIDLAICEANRIYATKAPLASSLEKTVSFDLNWYAGLSDIYTGPIDRFEEVRLLRLLEKYPANPLVLKALAAHARKASFHSAYLNLSLLSGCEGVSPGTLRQAMQSVGNPAFIEFLDTLVLPGDLHNDAGNYPPVVQAVLQASGVHNFPNSPASEEPARFPEARRLFSEGRDIGKIVALLGQGIEANPCHASSWNLLGACLRLQQEHRLAAASLRQALRLDPGHADALANLALSYAQLNADLNARGCALLAVLNSSKGHWAYESSLNLLLSSSEER